MKGTTHIIGGLAAAAITTHTFNVPVQEPIIFYTAALFGSVIPDICHPKSMVGRMIPIISISLGRIFGHRTITHSLLFVLVTMWLLSLVTFQNAADIQTGLVAGIISHIILDAMTPRGVKLLYPIQTSFRFPFSSQTGSVIGETAVCLVLLGVVVMMYI
ncbi:metal-dependent hydrolase [Halalkalibacter nanhaiisediminis]|uniref:Inner membrane protein n=1 Tax=Halalkalibacter nanhaiisediminis TaxID=688079 RepID=A0A562QQF9_9BACI|nr:metal-dependent hydrolase [Halalkalibacter nanhaiisediminis]TWI58992.1 inner membrane protein [Halalkalibacter nanhaiisediminis]